MTEVDIELVGSLDPLEPPDKPTPKPKHHVEDDDWPTYVKASLMSMFFGTKLNILLVCVPLAILSNTLGWDGSVTFIMALLALCPLAERLGFVTEQLALHTNPTIGGLLNATFGNATEMIVSLFAIRNGLLRVVQLSLLGSVLSNLLLVLGTAFFLGGLKYKVQTFSVDSVKANSSLLLLGMITLLLPALLDITNTQLHDDDSLFLSRFCSVVLLVVYAAFLVFQLKTHRYLFEGASGEPPIGAEQEQEEEEDDDDDEEEVLGLRGSLFWLTLITVFIALLSEYIVDTIEIAAHALDIPIAFVSTILLPIVGNAAEHASAVVFAMKNKMELSIGVAVGSSTQITLLAIPFCVIAAAAVGAPLSLDFAPFETGVFLCSILGATSIMADGRSNWLKGVVLIAAYVVLAAAFYFHQDPPGVNGATWANKDLTPDRCAGKRPPPGCADKF